MTAPSLGRTTNQHEYTRIDLGAPPSWDRGRLARIRSAQQSAVASGAFPAFLIPRGSPSRQDAGAPSIPGLPARRLSSRQDR